VVSYLWVDDGSVGGFGKKTMSYGSIGRNVVRIWILIVHIIIQLLLTIRKTT
jgi:hypothetical protein